MNDHFVIADKRGGTLSTAPRFAQDTRPCVGLELQSELGKQIYPVHRLDFEVSGLVMFALERAAHRKAQEWFESRQVGKLYQALSERVAPGVFALNEEMIWESRLQRGKKRSFESSHGQPALTLATWIGERFAFWFWELKPVTGRPHQLRFEMAKRGVPILGDRLYGAKENWSEPESIALRAVSLDFKECKAASRLGLPEILRADDLPPYEKPVS